MTCMMYLNGDFEGGATNFVDESQTLYKVGVRNKFFNTFEDEF